jgi:5'(3')-deoxyribonucleotidase
MKPKILIDMDDVLVDWTGEAFKTFGLNKQSIKLMQLLEEQWGMDHVLDEAKMWERLDELGAPWWANLPPLPWALNLYSSLCEVGDVCILTSPSEHPSSSAGKVEWIKKHLDTRDFLIGKPKHFCAHRGSILIDDRPENCAKFVEAGGNAQPWPSPYRMEKEDPTGEMNVGYAVRFVKEIGELIKDYR